MSRVIKIEQGNEFKVLVNEKGIEVDDFFYSQYAEAARHVTTIINATTNDHFSSDKEYLNNIISFCGERGAGKTTAMKTFTHALCEQTKKSKIFSDIKEKKFFSLKMIDPSSFESIHHVLDIVISLMFKDFEQIFKENTENFSNDLKYTMLTQFQTVYQNLAALRNPKKYQETEYDYQGDVQKLSNIASDINLKEHLYQLVNNYLKLNESSYLVLMIDDLDINIKCAYEMAEEIRRYLNIPNIIIIMAIRIEQLNYCVRKELMNDFMQLIKDNKTYDAELSTMVNKYLNKLIPESRRIVLPDLRVVSADSNDLVQIKYYKNVNGKPSLLPNLSSEKNISLETTILKYIFDKTHIVLVHRNQKVHPIIPSTLRELVMLYDYLGQMKENTQDNIAIFKNYFMNVWCKNNLNAYTNSIIVEWSMKPLDEKNKYLCEQIQMLINAFNEKQDDILKSFKDVPSLIYREDCLLYDSTIQNKKYSISIGTVLNLLMDVSSIINNDEIDKFISGCYLMYSILLNEIKDDTSFIREEEIMQPNRVSTIIAGSLWGDKVKDILRKNTTKFNNQQINRCIFKYEIIHQIEGFIKSNVTSNKNGSYSMSAQTYEKIMQEAKDYFYIIGSLSNFGLKDEECEWRIKLISGNNQIKTNAEFILDRLFMIDIDVPFICEKISQNENVFKYEENNARDLLKKYGINEEIRDLLIYNVELSRFVLDYCLERKPFSKGGDADKLSQYKNLFSQINNSICKVFNKYGPKDPLLIEKNDDEESIYEIISWFYSNKSEDEVNEIKDNPSYSLPSRKSSYKINVFPFRDRCMTVLNIIKEHHRSYSEASTWIDTLNRIIDKLINASKVETSDVDEYNKIYFFLKAMKK